MPIPIFLSYPEPFTVKQENFINKVKTELETNGFTPRTYGVTDVGMSVPLIDIKRMMDECYGLLSIAFKRYYVEKGMSKPDPDLAGNVPVDISKCWITSPYCHIESAMAFQINMPILIFREKEVIADGIFKHGVIDAYMPEFNIDDDKYFNDIKWTQLFDEWRQKNIEYKTKKQFKTNDIIEHIMSLCVCQGKKISCDELYKMFENTIDPTQTNYDGQKINNPDHFIRQLESYLDVDDIEAKYKLPWHSIRSDYIDICKSFFY